MPKDTTTNPLNGLEFCPRCGSGPRHKADTVECSDCGRPWSGPRLLDTIESEHDRLAGEKADRAFDPIRAAIDRGDLVITPLPPTPPDAGTPLTSTIRDPKPLTVTHTGRNEPDAGTEKALEQIELGPCALHDHFGSGECPDCQVRRELAAANALEDRLRQLSAKWRETAQWKSRDAGATLAKCADELDALLSERPTPHE